MASYSIKPIDCIFVKGYGFLCFAKNTDKNFNKTVNKTLSGKYCQKVLNPAR